MLTKDDLAEMERQREESTQVTLDIFAHGIKVAVFSGLAAFVVGLVFCFAIATPSLSLGVALALKLFGLMLFSFLGFYTGVQCVDVFMKRRFGPDFMVLLAMHRMRMAVTGAAVPVIETCEQHKVDGRYPDDARLANAITGVATVYENVSSVQTWLKSSPDQRPATAQILPEKEWQQTLSAAMEQLADFKARPPVATPVAMPAPTPTTVPTFDPKLN